MRKTIDVTTGEVVGVDPMPAPSFTSNTAEQKADGEVDRMDPLLIALAARIEQVADPTLTGQAAIMAAIKANIGPLYRKARGL